MALCISCRLSSCVFFNDTATTEIYTLSLHDALPILYRELDRAVAGTGVSGPVPAFLRLDRKSTRLNSSHGYISYAVFWLKKERVSWRFLAALVSETGSGAFARGVQRS